MAVDVCWRHAIRTELAAEALYVEHTSGGAVPSYDAATHLRALQSLCEVDAWETTYLHVLHRGDPVFTWVFRHRPPSDPAGAADDLRPDFEAEFRRRLREACPDDGHGVVLRFRRIFVVVSSRPEPDPRAWRNRGQ